jgi:hypothetical protein
MNIKFYPNGTAEVFESGKRIAAGRIGAQPGQKGYSYTLYNIVNFPVDNDVRKEYNNKHE